MNLPETARILCEPDTSYSVFERAIELYEFQIFIFAPREKALQRNARIFAAMKILEQIERSVFPVSAHETN